MIKFFEIKHKSYNENKIIIQIYKHKKCRHKFAIINVKLDKKGAKMQDKRKETNWHGRYNELPTKTFTR